MVLFYAYMIGLDTLKTRCCIDLNFVSSDSQCTVHPTSRPLYFFSLPVLLFSQPHIIFSLPHPSTFLYAPQFFATYPILPRSERVFYSAVTYTLSGTKGFLLCVHVLCAFFTLCARSLQPTHTSPPSNPPCPSPHHLAPPCPPPHNQPGPTLPATPHPIRAHPASHPSAILPEPAHHSPTWTHPARPH